MHPWEVGIQHHVQPGQHIIENAKMENEKKMVNATKKSYEEKQSPHWAAGPK